MSSYVVNSISNLSNYITSRITKTIPRVTINNEQLLSSINYIGDKLAAPHTNRLAMGATAIVTQPVIDLKNKKVDDQTRKISAARTLAKIIIGTSTGVVIRYACLKAIDYCTKLPEEVTTITKNPKLRQLFTPSQALITSLNSIKKYKVALGTFLGLGVMLFTNFLIDAPLTKLLTNIFIEKIQKNEKSVKGEQHD